MWKEIRFFVEMSGAEQKSQLSGSLSTVDDFRHRRMGTGAVGACLALTEYVTKPVCGSSLIADRYCYAMSLPPGIMQDSGMKRLWDETNIIVCTCEARNSLYLL